MGIISNCIQMPKEFMEGVLRLGVVVGEGFKIKNVFLSDS